MRIKLTIDKAAKARGIHTQILLAQEVQKKTGVIMRAATISDMYRNNKDSINKENLLLIMRALEIKDFNEILTIEE